MRCQYKPFYFEDFPIGKLSRLDLTHMHFGKVRTGGMKKEAFLALKNNIEEQGLTNPIVVEVDSGPRYRIAMGNNRVEAISQLGYSCIKALVLFKATSPTADLGQYTRIEDGNLEAFMREVHPGDDLWKKSGWADRLLKFVSSRAW